MAKFELTYADGSKEVVEQSDCTTVEQFINVKFGTNRQGSTKVILAGEEKKSVKKAAKGD